MELERLRRRSTEVDTLRARIDQAERKVKTLRAKVHQAERKVRALQASRGITSAGTVYLDMDNTEWIARAKQFEYYWLNANKKIDPLAMRPFGPVARRVLEDGKTYLSADRLYTLWQSIEGMPMTAAAVVEVGVFQGGSAKLIAEAMLASGRMLPFYACDTFCGHTIVDESVDGRHRVGQQFRSARVAVLTPGVLQYLDTYDFLQVLEGDIRDTVSGFAEQHAFGMVHVDVDVHPVTKFCLEFFAPRLVIGGTIVVDDYGFTTCKGVRKAVDDFLVSHRGQFWAMHLLTAQAVLTRTS